MDYGEAHAGRSFSLTRSGDWNIRVGWPFDYLKKKCEEEKRERPNAEEQAHRQKVKMDVRAMDCGWGLGISFRFAMIVPENPIC